MLPLGSLLVGAVSEKIGAPNAILCQGIAGVLIAFVFFKLLHKKKKTMPPDPVRLEEAEELLLEKV